MILYREKDLDEAYKLDCKSRTKKNMPWVMREEFRSIYEQLVEIYMIKLAEDPSIDMEDAPEFVIASVKDLLFNDLTFIPE